MPLSNREMKLLSEIRAWENTLHAYEPNDFELTYEKYLERAFSLLPNEVQVQFFNVLDNWIFHLHAMIQGSQLQMDAKERILTAARVFDPSIERIEDLRILEIEKLQYIAEQQIARHRFYSFLQGGVSGTGTAILLGSDIPAMAVINLRVIQLIAMSYGYEVNNPFEMMTSLKIFHGATSPRRIQKRAWEQLLNEYRESKESYFYEGNDEITNISWFELPIIHMLKAITILIFKKRTVRNLPIVSMAIGAGTNYQVTRKVTNFAHNYYQMRYLLEKEDGNNE